MKSIGRDKLQQGDFNHMSQETKPDGSVIVTLTSRKYPEVYTLQVWDLYGPEEEVLVEVVSGGDEE